MKMPIRRPKLNFRERVKLAMANDRTCKVDYQTSIRKGWI